MVQWTDKHINWQSLSAKEIRGLINTWGDKPAKAPKVAKVAVPAKGKVKVAAERKVVRQKHFGEDGEVKFVDHRNLYVGFWGGKVVVTKKTEAACREFLKSEFGAE